MHAQAYIYIYIYIYILPPPPPKPTDFMISGIIQQGTALLLLYADTRPHERRVQYASWQTS